MKKIIISILILSVNAFGGNFEEVKSAYQEATEPATSFDFASRYISFEHTYGVENGLCEYYFENDPAMYVTHMYHYAFAALDMVMFEEANSVNYTYYTNQIKGNDFVVNASSSCRDCYNSNAKFRVNQNEILMRWENKKDGRIGYGKCPRYEH